MRIRILVAGVIAAFLVGTVSWFRSETNLAPQGSESPTLENVPIPSNAMGRNQSADPINGGASVSLVDPSATADSFSEEEKSGEEMRPVIEGTLPEPWTSSVLVAQSETPLNDKGLFKRISILESPDHPWPIRVEETIRRPKAGGKEKRLKSIEMVANHLLVGMPESADRAAIQAQIEQQGFSVTAHESDGSLYYIGPVPLETDSLPAAIEQLQLQTLPPDYAEPDYIVRALATPNDPAFQEGRLWGLHNVDAQLGRVDTDIDGPEAWETRRDAADIVVAVIDTGIRYTHEDLAANMWINSGEIPGDGIDNDNNGVIDDVHGFNARDGEVEGDPNDDGDHGTHCAGTIGAVGDNGVGSTGVAWNVQLMAARFLGGPNGSGSTSDGIQCVDYAVQNGARIISASYGGGGRSQASLNAISRARQAGVIFVAAAGNDSLNNDINPQFPASYDLDNIVAVGSHDRHDQLSDFSNFGASSVDIVAPGTSIFSTVSTADDAYGVMSGTSMATPHVSGMLAVIRSAFPEDDYKGLIDRLYAAGVESPAYIGQVATGRRANLQAALESETLQPLPIIVSTLEQGLNGRTVFDLGDALTLSVRVEGQGPFTFQWQRNGTVIPSARSSRFVIPALATEDHGEFQVRVTNAGGTVSSRVRIAVRGPIAAIGEAVEAPELDWFSLSEPRWRAQSVYSRGGNQAAESGPIEDDGRTEMETSVVGPGLFSFWWQVDSEDGFDFLRFYVDGTEITSITGDSGWLKVEHAMAEPGRQYQLKWVYEKDFSESAGLDRGWVDQVSYVDNTLTPPTIASQPQSVTGEVGSTVRLNVVAEGSPPLRYQWFKDNQLIPDAVGPELSLANLQASDEARYRVEVTNDAGQIRSRDVAVRLQLIAPTITRQPVGEVLDEGDPLSLVVAASGTVPMTFQWQKDGADIPGASAATLSIASTSVLDSGSYQVVVSNAAGTVSSETVSVLVNEITLLPTITYQPQSTVVNQGETVVLRVSAAGNGPFSYQWSRDGEPVPTGTDRTLRLENATVADSGSYTVVVTNPFGTATSRVATVEVRQLLDELGAALDNSELTFTTAGNANWFAQSLDTTDGEDAAQAGSIGDSQTSALHTSVVGPGLLTFQWKVSSEEGFDGLALLIDGEFVDGITGTAAWHEFQIQIPSGPHEVTWIYEKDGSVAEELDTAWLDRIVFVSTLEVAPVLTRQPSSVAVLPNESVLFVADAVGGNDLQWQWFHEGSPILGATDSQLQIVQPQVDDVGSYFAEATNAFGTTRTREVDLSFVSFGQAIGEGLDESSLVWVNDETNPWRVDFVEHVDNMDSIGVAFTSEASETAFETTVEGPAVVSFWWVVAYNPDADHDFVFEIDGRTVGWLWSHRVGDAFWQQQLHAIPPGEHVLRWEFDDLEEWTADSGGWVDQFELFRPLVESAAYNGPLDTQGLTWSASGDAPWITVPTSLATGETALRSGSLADGQSSSLSVDVDFAEATVVAFEWTTLSENARVFGRFEFYVDGVLVGRIEDQDTVFNENIDVRSPFQSHASRVEAGAHRLEWRYLRRFSLSQSEGMDGGGVLDGVVFVPANDDTSEPFSAAVDIAPLPFKEFHTRSAQPWSVSDTDPLVGATSLLVTGEFEGRSYLETATSELEAIAFGWRLNGGSVADRLYVEFESETSPAAARGPVLTLNGVTEWEEELLILPAGNHRLRWIFERRGALSPASVGQVDPFELFTYDEALGAVLETSITDWQASGSVPWVTLALPDIGREHVLVSASQLGNSVLSLGEQRARLSATLRGPGQLQFDWFALSDPELSVAFNNFFTFDVDGSAVAQIDRPEDWATVAVDIPAGEHLVSWTYALDFIGDSGHGFLDKVIYEREGADTSLQYSRTAEGLRLTWVDAAGTLRLESTASIGSPAWAPVEGVQVTGAQRSVTVDLTSGHRFFRLAQ